MCVLCMGVLKSTCCVENSMVATVGERSEIKCRIWSVVVHFGGLCCLPWFFRALLSECKPVVAFAGSTSFLVRLVEAETSAVVPSRPRVSGVVVSRSPETHAHGPS